MASPFAVPLGQIQTELRSLHSLLLAGQCEVAAAKLRALVSSVELFEASPRDLDPVLGFFVENVAQIYLFLKEKCPNADCLAAVTALAYTATKIRGHKVISNYFSADVYLLPKLTGFLGDGCRDHEKYFLVLWLCRLVLSPFPLELIAGGMSEVLYEKGTRVLYAGTLCSRTQEISAVFLSKLLLRPDCVLLRQLYLRGVFDDWMYYVQDEKLSNLMVLSQLLKQKQVRDFLLAEFGNERGASGARSLMAELTDLLLLEVSKLRYDQTYTLNSTTHLYLVKVLTKTAVFCVLGQSYCLVAQFVNVLVGFLDMEIDTLLRECIAKSLSRITIALREKAANYSDQLVEYVLCRISDDKSEADDCEERYLDVTQEQAGGKEISSSRSESPTSANSESAPPKKYSLSDSSANSESATPKKYSLSDFSISRYHTALLFLGFLSLSRNLPSGYLAKTCRILQKTLYFSRQKYNFIPSNQIRDSSCFCAWAIFRQFSTLEIVDHQNFSELRLLILSLVNVAIFDDDYMIRRCAISCLQEFVGRHGAIFLEKMETKTNGTAEKISAVTIRLVELFSFSGVSSLSELHTLILPFIALGFPRELFFSPLLDELFTDTSFAVKKLAARNLRTVLECTDSPSFDVGRLAYNAQSAIRCLTDKFTHLYALAEIRMVLSQEQVEAIEGSVLALSFSIHAFEALARGESLLHWMNVRSPAAETAGFERYVSLALEVSKLAWSPALEAELQYFFASVQIAPAVFSDICTQISLYGNELLGSAIVCADLTSEQLHEVFALVESPKIDTEIRARIFTSFPYSSADIRARHSFHRTLLVLLDDYSLTERGDVGLHVRLAAMESLEACYSSMNNAEKEAVLLKLLRIGGEPIDRLREQAFLLLCTTTSFSVLHATDSYASYFSEFIRYYSEVCASGSAGLHMAFWEGIVHCAGALTGPNNLINACFQNVVRMLSVAPASFAYLLNLLKMQGRFSQLPQRKQKTLLHALNLVSRLLDAGVSPAVDHDTLFVRVYNLHINTTSMGRILPAVRVFLHISRSPFSPQLQQKARKRLLWLCDRREAQAAALEAIFDVAVEQSMGLLLCREGVTPEFRATFLRPDGEVD